jgi:hypothetical protein
MRWKLVLSALLMVPFLAMPVGAQPTTPTAVCPYGQTCGNGATPVPFPVISPVQGLKNILSLPQNNNQPPPPVPYAPIATPPPVLPPGVTPPSGAQ